MVKSDDSFVGHVFANFNDKVFNILFNVYMAGMIAEYITAPGIDLCRQHPAGPASQSGLC